MLGSDASAMHIQYWLSALYDSLPGPLGNAVDLVYHCTLFLTDCYHEISELSTMEILRSLHLEVIIPSLISFLAIYLTVMSLYRTTTLFLRTAIFFVKWGGVIAVVVSSLGYIASTLGLLDQYAVSSRYSPSPNVRPRPWNTFQQHQQWRERKDQYDADAEKASRETMEKIMYAAMDQGGWWSILSGLAANADMQGDATTSRGWIEKSKEGKGKGKVR